jgi:hypothetical protein
MDLYGKLSWKYASDSDINYNIKVNGNQIWAIASKGEGKKKVKPLDMQQIPFH